MKLPSSTEEYLAMIPRRSSLVSCFGSGRESMSSSMIAVVLSLMTATGCARRVVFMWIPPDVCVVATSGKHANGAFTILGMVRDGTKAFVLAQRELEVCFRGVSVRGTRRITGYVVGTAGRPLRAA